MQKLASLFFGFLVLGATAIGSNGCVDNNSSIFVHSVKVLDAGAGCVCQPDPEGAFYSTGFIDTAVRSSYQACVLVGNQLIRTQDDDRLRVETSRVTLFEAEVEIFDANGSSLTSFSQPISSFIDAASGASAGFGVAGITLIDPATLGAIDTGAGGQTIVARVKVFGESLGGADVESGPFDFPIQVCSNCLGCFEPEDCETAPDLTCRVGQDTSPDCRCIPNPADPTQNASSVCAGPIQSCGG